MGNRRLEDVSSAVHRFAEILDGHRSFDERLARSYNDLRLSLSSAMQDLSNASVNQIAGIEPVRSQIEQKMMELFSGKVDLSLLRVRGYTGYHSDIYRQLVDAQPHPVPGWRLRINTGDQVHTERRTRELRDLGFQIDTMDVEGQSAYLLCSVEADLAYGAAYQLRRNAIDSKKVTGHAAVVAIELAELTARLPERKQGR